MHASVAQKLGYLGEVIVSLTDIGFCAVDLQPYEVLARAASRLRRKKLLERGLAYACVMGYFLKGEAFVKVLGKKIGHFVKKSAVASVLIVISLYSL